MQGFMMPVPRKYDIYHDGSTEKELKKRWSNWEVIVFRCYFNQGQISI